VNRRHLVGQQYCATFVEFARYCADYATIAATSTYTPSFAYDGEVCVSAVLSVYGPVFLGTVLLSAVLPAGIETFVMPRLAPWCYRNSDSSKVARTGMELFQAGMLNVWPVLAEADALPSDFSLDLAELDYLAQCTVERAFVQVIATLIIALTFGIVVPAVGGACAVAAFVQLLHHRHVLGQIVLLGRLERPAVVPNLMGCTDVPVSCTSVVVVTVVLVWVCGAVGYLNPVIIGVMLSCGLTIMIAGCGVVVWWRRSRSKAFPQHQDRAQSIASSDTSQGMLMESLITEDKITEE